MVNLWIPRLYVVKPWLILVRGHVCVCINPRLNRATAQLHGLGFPRSDRWGVYISAWPRIPAFPGCRARRVDAHFTAPLQGWSRHGTPPARGPAWWPLSVTTRPVESGAGRLTWHTGPCHPATEANTQTAKRASLCRIDALKRFRMARIIFDWGLNYKRLHYKAQARPWEATRCLDKIYSLCLLLKDVQRLLLNYLKLFKRKKKIRLKIVMAEHAS